MKNKKKLKVYLKENNLVGKKELQLYNKAKFLGSNYILFLYLFLNLFISYTSIQIYGLITLALLLISMYSTINPDAIIKIIDEDNIFISSKNGISKVDAYQVKKIFWLHYKITVNDESYYVIYGNIKNILK